MRITFLTSFSLTFDRDFVHIRMSVGVKLDGKALTAHNAYHTGIVSMVIVTSLVTVSVLKVSTVRWQTKKKTKIYLQNCRKYRQRL